MQNVFFTAILVFYPQIQQLQITLLLEFTIFWIRSSDVDRPVDSSACSMGIDWITGRYLADNGSGGFKLSLLTCLVLWRGWLGSLAHLGFFPSPCNLKASPCGFWQLDFLHGSSRRQETKAGVGQPLRGQPGIWHSIISTVPYWSKESLPSLDRRGGDIDACLQQIVTVFQMLQLW